MNFNFPICIYIHIYINSLYYTYNNTYTNYVKSEELYSNMLLSFHSPIRIIIEHEKYYEQVLFMCDLLTRARSGCERDNHIKQLTRWLIIWSITSNKEDRIRTWRLNFTLWWGVTIRTSDVLTFVMFLILLHELGFNICMALLETFFGNNLAPLFHNFCRW